MTELDQAPFQFGDFTENPEPRCPCLLLLDTSLSMAGPRIQQLNEGLQTFKTSLSQDSLALKRVEIAIVTFGPVQIEGHFQTADTWQPPHLSTSGDTPMGAAITAGLDLLRQRKDQVRANGIELFRPWVFLITDGAPTDSWHQAAQQVKEGEEKKAFAFFGVGVEGANLDILAKICVRPPAKLIGLNFRELFTWLSSSLSSVSASQPGDVVHLPSNEGWAQV